MHTGKELWKGLSHDDCYLPVALIWAVTGVAEAQGQLTLDLTSAGLVHLASELLSQRAVSTMWEVLLKDKLLTLMLGFSRREVVAKNASNSKKGKRAKAYILKGRNFNFSERIWTTMSLVIPVW